MLKALQRAVRTSMGIYDPPSGQSVYGLLAEFSDPAALLHAARQVRKAGYQHFDAHSPFPIHGMDEAMGLGNSKVGFVALGGTVTGLALAWWMQWWMGAVDYPLNISGKPFFAIEPSVPIMFELTVLFSALAAVAGMLALNGLPRPYNPLFYSQNFSRVTDDGFFLFVAASDAKFDLVATRQLLEQLGGYNIEVIEDRGEEEWVEAPAAPAEVTVNAT
ncbi:DUF3341 domain-containing protein [Rhodothermus bifroesti]|uniref:DUF3341 domain-containing protein n=1 Tax=Rhodothermus marinus TaxID=29549 RepID=A0A7V2B2E9_RHOMR|nr:DUF3341 domain-containing protein [Rhodothermus bifroesti]GBD01052.1 hypothetical protein HRbin18_00770 [bacterium HR18]